MTCWSLQGTVNIFSTYVECMARIGDYEECYRALDLLRASPLIPTLKFYLTFIFSLFYRNGANDRYAKYFSVRFIRFREMNLTPNPTLHTNPVPPPLFAAAATLTRPLP